MNKKLLAILLITLITFSVLLPIALLAIEQVDDDFRLELLVNGEDTSTLDTIAIEPDGNLIVYLHIFEVRHEVVLHSLTMSINVCG